MKLLDYNNFLNEGLIKTYPISIYKDNLLNNLNILNLDLEIEINYDNETFQLKTPKVNFKELTIINSYVNNLGYFLTKFIIKRNNKTNSFKYNSKTFEKQTMINDGLILFYESKFDEQINITDKLYHATEMKNIEKILKNGLYPKLNSKIEYHSERIYLSKNKNDCIKLIPRLRAFSLNMNIPFVLLEINKSDKYYLDSKSDGIYTYNNIIKNDIKLLKKIYTIDNIIDFDDIKFTTKEIIFYQDGNVIHSLNKN